ncbi:MAG: penicillin-binding protein 2 [Chloroflexi bacterium]|nr:penicillin-binding protein 2 [Chloroflexota bacterium]
MNIALRRLYMLLLLAYLAVGGGLGYWVMVRGPELLGRSDNPRRALDEAQVQRGRILDRKGRPLAWTTFEKGQPVRHYAYPPLVHTVGYISSRYGLSGVEAGLDTYLSGRSGINPWSTQLQRWLHRVSIGDDVVLTLDLDLQQVADQALGDRIGAVVVQDPTTGDILALASHPYFDLEKLQGDLSSLQNSPNSPLLNRSLQGLFTPGSVFKTFTLAVALQEHKVVPGQILDDGAATLDVDGFKIKCGNNPPGVNSFDLYHAYAYSCNLSFARMALDVGIPAIITYARRYGIGEAIPLEVPTAATRLSSNLNTISRPELASLGFGQGELLLTPLQVNLIGAAVAQGGQIYAPHLVSRIVSHEGNVVQKSTPSVWRMPITPEVASQVKEALVVSVQDGYGKPAALPNVQVGGKTGTAETGPNQLPHAWFIGLAPADHPRVIVTVVVEHGGAGSTAAAPVAKSVLQAALNLAAK